ncbi:MAG: GNAT family N-acetyltransferase [Armatimonadota bacterium]
MIEIVSFEPGMAGEVARCYNEAVEPLPYCYPVPVERFATVAGLAHRRLRDETLLVARDGDGVAGFVHLGIALPARDEEPPGEPAVIRFVTYQAGKRAVGQRLLQHAEEWAREHGRSEIHAFNAEYRYRFYHFWYAHLSEHIGHVQGLLGMNGYRTYNGEIYFVWRDYQPPAAARPGLEFELDFNWQDGPLGTRLSLGAMQGSRQIGVCNMDHGVASPAPDASDWCYCDWLWVTDKLQGHRLGRFLLVTALDEMRKRGCKHATISTNVQNYRAALFYSNLGYRFVDATYAWSKKL